MIEHILALKRPHTRTAYAKAWEMWTEFCGDPMTATPLEGMRWTATMKSRYAPATVHLRVEAVRSIYESLVALQAVVFNPLKAAHSTLPRSLEQVRPTKLVPLDRVTDVIHAPDPRTREGIRDRAFLAVLFGGGLRISEARGLNLGDITISEGGTNLLMLRRTKGRRSEAQPVPVWVSEHVSPLVSQRSAERATNESPLFVSYARTGFKRLDDRVMRRIYAERLEACGLHGYAPHSARATFATMLKSDGYEDREVARALRHSTTFQVELYDKRHLSAENNVGRKINYRAKKD